MKNSYKRLLGTVVLSCLSLTCLASYHKGDRVVLMTLPGCQACAEAKSDLRANLVPYKEDTTQRWGVFPKLYVNGVFMGYGVDAVERYLHD